MSDTLTLRVPDFPRLSDWLSVWLLEPLAARSLYELLSRLDLRAHIREELPPAPKAEVIDARGGAKIAVVPLVGTLMKSRSSVGGTSTVQARREIRAAAQDPDVSAILLSIDSPGGTVAGLQDLADDVRAAGKRKPVWAQVEDMAASAAFWVASQAGQVFAGNNTALVGSIGTFLTIYDQSQAAERDGVRVLHFATGPLKGAGTPGTAVTEEQEGYFQGIVNGVQQEFDRAVRSGRGLDAAGMEAVRSGGVWKASEAQARGLIDGVQPVNKTLDQLAAAALTERPGTGRRRAGGLPTLSQKGLPTIGGTHRGIRDLATGK